MLKVFYSISRAQLFQFFHFINLVCKLSKFLIIHKSFYLVHFVFLFHTFDRVKIELPGARGKAFCLGVYLTTTEGKRVALIAHAAALSFSNGDVFYSLVCCSIVFVDCLRPCSHDAGMKLYRHKIVTVCNGSHDTTLQASVFYLRWAARR